MVFNLIVFKKQKEWSGLLCHRIIQKMKRRYKLYLRIITFGVLIHFVFMMYSCKAQEQRIYHTSDEFIVRKIKKCKNNVFLIYATRNDTIYKIASHYNGIKNKSDKKLKKGSRFTATLFSQFLDFDKAINAMPNLGVIRFYYGVPLIREPEKGIDDVWVSEELNGLYFAF